MVVTLMLFLLVQASRLQQNYSMKTLTLQRLGEDLFVEGCHERHARELREDSVGKVLHRSSRTSDLSEEYIL